MSLKKLDRETRLKYMMAIWYLNRHPVVALKILAGIELAPHQRICARKMHTASSVILMLSRGLSKSFLDGVTSVMIGVLEPGTTQVVLTRGFRGGKMILREVCQPMVIGNLDGQQRKKYISRCLENYNESKNVLRIINRDPDLWQIRFVNNSAVTTGPLGKDADSKTSPLRGLRANRRLVLDEANEIEQDLYNTVLRPFARVGTSPIRGARLRRRTRFTKVESGTVRFDYQRFSKELDHVRERMMNGDDKYSVLEFNYEDCFYFINNEKPKDLLFDVDNWIKKKKMVFTYMLNLQDMFDEINSGTTSVEDFLSENKNRRQVSIGTEFPVELLDSIIGRDIDAKYLDKVQFDEDSIMDDPSMRGKELVPLLTSDDPCILGVDPAREHDDAGFVLMRLGPLRSCRAPFCDIPHASRLQRVEYKKIAVHIRWYLEQFPGIKFIYMDAGGGGYAVRDFLWHPEDTEHYGALPIYDPSDEATPQHVKEIGLPILKLDSASNESNTRRVIFTKAQMQQRKILVSPFVYYTGSNELDETYKAIKLWRRQMSYIMSEPSGNYRKYKVKESSYRKDLFSATLLAMQGVSDMLYSDINSAEISNTFYVVRKRAGVPSGNR